LRASQQPFFDSIFFSAQLLQTSDQQAIATICQTASMLSPSPKILYFPPALCHDISSSWVCPLVVPSPPVCPPPFPLPSARGPPPSARYDAAVRSRMVRYNLHDGTMARTESVAGASEPPPRTHTVIRTPVRPHTRPAPPLQWRGGGRLGCGVSLFHMTVS